MTYDFNRDWLIRKFEELQRRTLQALQQLDDEQVNWRPDPESLSISTLIRHIEGNLKERILKGILHEEISRDREEELKQSFVPKAELETIVQTRFQQVIDILSRITDEVLEQKQKVRSHEKTNLDTLHQCAAHYSEHMGQIFYIAKQLLKENYKSTSI
ncbi:DinB family protein [Paenibacillus hodogayensis]|uniref:DinB family protein n=1 Tax=Paenibacillus hodogayensis TaxID=279208 RepID=A0ABV5VUY9_9BACL